MIPQQNIISHIKRVLRSDMEGKSLEQLNHYRPKEYNLLPDVIEALEAEGYDPEHLDSGGFYWRLKANWNDILDSKWFDRTLEEQTREAYYEEQLTKHPYKSRGVSKGDFYA